MTTPLNISYLVLPHPQTNSLARNGRYVDAWLQYSMAHRANQVCRWRTKQVYSYSYQWDGDFGFVTPGNRCRFAFRSSSHARFLWAHVIMTSWQNGAFNTDDHVLLTVSDGGGTFGTAKFAFGPWSVDDGGDQTYNLNSFRAGSVPISDGGVAQELTPNTEYTGVFSENDYGFLVGVSVFEVSLDPTVENGYVPQTYSQGSPIYDEDRGDLAVMVRNAWKQNAAPLFQWCVDQDATPRTRLSATAINAVDGTSTTVSAASPGFTIDLRNRTRLNSTTVPCVLAVFAGDGGGAGTGVIRLKDSGGVAVASINITLTPTWWSTTVNLPATLAKYDLTLEGDGAATTVSLYAASLYQYSA